jgi:hypothetical protein
MEMFYDSLYDNDHLKFEMERASRKAAEGWRFRHLPSLERRVLSAILGTVHGLLQRAFYSEKAAIGTVRQQPSY